MKAPLTFELPPDIYSRPIPKKRRSVPCNHKVWYARNRLVHSRRISLFRQSFEGFTFYLELITYYVKQAVIIKIKAENPCLMFIYAIHNELEFSVPGQPRLTIVPQGHCFAHSLPEGEYSWPVETGTKKFVYFILRTEWMIKMRSEYPELADVIQRLQDGDASNQVFQPYLMTENTVRQLKKLRDCKLKSKIELEEALFHTINKLVIEYHNYLASPRSRYIPSKSNRQIAFEVRDHIIAEVGKGVIPNVSAISALFNLEPKALRRNCLKSFKMNIHDLIIDAQMKIAHDLLINRKLKVKDIATKLGYSEPAIFSRRFKRYFNYSPTDFKKHTGVFCFQ